MKKGLLILTAIVLMLSIIPVVVLAAPQPKDNPANDQGKNIYLYPKDTNWDPIFGGAWGKVSYGKNNVSFDGHNLEPGDCYWLIVYGPDWPDAECIGCGEVNNGGNIQIGGKVALEDGDKVWLVPCADVDCDAGEMIGWNPSTYLFEHDEVGPKD